MHEISRIDILLRIHRPIFVFLLIEIHFVIIDALILFLCKVLEVRAHLDHIPVLLQQNFKIIEALKNLVNVVVLRKAEPTLVELIELGDGYVYQPDLSLELVLELLVVLPVVVIVIVLSKLLFVSVFVKSCCSPLDMLNGAHRHEESAIGVVLVNELALF